MSKYQGILDELNASIKGPTTGSYSKESEWLIRILEGADKYHTGSANTSHMTGASEAEQPLSNFAPIYDYQFALTRAFNADSMTNDLVPSGVVGHELKVVAPFAAIRPGVHEVFSKNTVLTSVTLARIGTINPGGAASSETSAATGSQHSLAEYTFKDVYITGLVSKQDLISLAFRYNSVTYRKIVIGQSTGTAVGTESSAYHNLANGHSTPAATHNATNPV